MRLALEITMDNAAFAPGDDTPDNDESGRGEEVHRILVALGVQLSLEGIGLDTRHDLWDANGNTVGKVAVFEN